MCDLNAFGMVTAMNEWQQLYEHRGAQGDRQRAPEPLRRGFSRPLTYAVIFYASLQQSWLQMGQLREASAYVCVKRL